MSILLFASLAAVAQPPVQPSVQPPVDSLRGAVTGVVYDSVAKAPLANADVQLLPATSADGRAYTTVTDGEGRYRVDGVAVGAYVVGFLHPRLDSLGVAMQPTELTVAANRTARVNLALPSATAVQRQICAANAVSDTTGLVVGFVRDAATGAPRDSARVRVEWAEFSIGRGGAGYGSRGGTVTTRANGWFAACGVPVGALVMMSASAGADSSGTIPVDVTGRAVASQSLFVGSGATRVVGAVRTVNGEPVVGARVALPGGADTALTNAAGAFTLAPVPVGSRVLEVRAVGFLPKREVVAVRAESSDGPGTVAEVTLTSFSAYLDTVKVTRQRLFSTDRNGFEARRRASASGYFFDRERVDRMRPLFTTDLFRMVPGVQVLPSSMGRSVITMRGNMGRCVPEMYVDGVLVDGLGGDPWMLDFLASPDRIDGIEVYNRGGTAPAMFTRTLGGCGSIVIWTRQPDPLPPKPEKKKTAVPSDSLR